jgi:transposase InsO family protein
MDRWFKEKGVLHETTVGYSPQSNGAAERLNRTILEKVVLYPGMDKRL